MLVGLLLLLSSLITILDQRLYFILIFIYILQFIKNKRLYILLISLFISLLFIRINFIHIGPNFNHDFLVIRSDEKVTILRQLGINYTSFSKHHYQVGDVIKISGKYKPLKKSKENSNLLIRHYNGSLTINKSEYIKENQIIKTIFNYSNQFENRDYLLKLFLNYSFDTQNDMLSMIISSGLMITTLFYTIIKTIKLLVKEKYIQTIELCLLIIFIIIFGFSFSISRLILSYIIRKSSIKQNTKPLIEMSLLCLIYPLVMYTQIFWILLVIKSQNFLFEKENRTIKRITALGLISMIFNFKVNILMLLFFTSLRQLSLFFVLISTFELIVKKDLVAYQLIELMASFNFKLELKGQLSLILLVFLVYTLIFVKTRKDIIINTSLVVIIHLLSIFTNPNYQIVYLNVKQGDATLLISPFYRETYLIDTGSSRNRFDLLTGLNQFGIYKLDEVIITHDDHDHSGNLNTLSQHYNFKTIDSKDSYIDSNYFVFKFLLKDKTYHNDNDNSLIINVLFNDHSLLFTGDVSKAVERDILLENPSLRINHLHLGHHGSKTSSDPYFIHKIYPDFAIISSDPSVYNHPHQEVLQTLANFKIKTLQTSEDHHLHFIYINNKPIIITKKHLVFPSY